MSDDTMRPLSRPLDRRRFMAYFSGIGLGGTLLPGVLWSQLASAQDGAVVTASDIEAAEKLAGLEFTPEEREDIARNVQNQLANFERVRTVPLPNSVPPALHFDPVLPGMRFESERRPVRYRTIPVPDVPGNLEEVAFWPVMKLARAVGARRISAVDLTEMYLARLKRLDFRLHCVITLTEERAREQARRADAEIAAWI